MGYTEPGSVLPVPGKKSTLITSALPYVNNVPHLGNIIGSVLSADVFARYSRARGHPTLFVCGTDEYGTATETKALSEGITPQELCAKFRKLHGEIYDWFEISFDIFGQTSTQHQTEIAQDIFTNLHKNGYLEEKTSTQPYCEEHKAFLADRFVEGECPNCHYEDARGDQCDKCGKLLDPLDLINPRCKVDGASPQKRETSHIYLDLEKLQPLVEKWFSGSGARQIWSPNGISITNNWLNEGLKPRGITRDLKWGTPLPVWLKGYENKVLYVWFDATIGYISITANYTPEWRKWWYDSTNVRLFQFMGKDNVPFHSVVFPASQLGTKENWTMVNNISTTEYLNYEGGKFSKSRNHGVFGDTAKLTGVPPDVWRYYLLANRPESSDGEFVWSSFLAANNSELVANLGNFVNRVLKFTTSPNTYSSTVPDFTATSKDVFDTAPWITDLNSYLSSYIKDLDAVKIRAALSTVMHVSSLGNKLLQANLLDNKLFAEKRALCDGVIGLALNIVHLLGHLVEPYLPATSASIFAQLNVTENVKASAQRIPDAFIHDAIKPGHKLGKAAHLFQMIKPEKEKEWREMFGAKEMTEEEKKKAEKKAANKAAKEAKKAKKTAGESSGAAKLPEIQGGKAPSQHPGTEKQTEVDGLAAAGLDEEGKPVASADAAAEGVKKLQV